MLAQRCRRSRDVHGRSPPRTSGVPPAGCTAWSRRSPSTVASPVPSNVPGGPPAATATLAVHTTSRPNGGVDERAGPRHVGADLPLERGRRARRVEPAILTTEGPGQGRALLGLRLAQSSHPGATAGEPRRARRPASSVKSASSDGVVSVPSSGNAALGDDRPRIEPVVHPHQGDARLAVAGEDRRRDRRRTAMPRKQRRVEVERAELEVEERPRDDLPVVGEDGQRRVRARGSHRSTPDRAAAPASGSASIPRPRAASWIGVGVSAASATGRSRLAR